MRIPLPKMLRKWRERQFRAEMGSTTARWALKSWAWLAKRPALYRLLLGAGIGVLGQFGGRGRFSSLPFASGWTSKRDLAAPLGDTFISQYHKGARGDQSGELIRNKVCR